MLFYYQFSNEVWAESFTHLSNIYLLTTFHISLFDILKIRKWICVHCTKQIDMKMYTYRKS